MLRKLPLSVLRLLITLTSLVLSSHVYALGPSKFHPVFTPAERAWIDAHPEISLVYTTDLHPAVIPNDDGTYKGIVPDYLELLSQDTGIKFNLEVFDSWSAALNHAIDGEAEMVGPVTSQLAQTSEFLFSLPLISTQTHVFAIENTHVPGHTLDGLTGKRVGFLESVQYILRFAQENPQIHFVPFKKTAEMTAALDQGDIEFIVQPEWFNYHLQNMGNKNYRIDMTIPALEAQGYLAVQKEWPELLMILNKTIAANESEFEAINDKWLEFNQTRPVRDHSLPLTPEEHQWLADHPEIQVGFDPAWAPLEFTDKNGIPQGIAAQYLHRIEDLLGIRFNYQVDENWANTYDKLSRSEVDLLPLVSSTEERQKQVLFSPPYLSIPIGIFSTENRAYANGLSQLKDKTLVVVKGHSIEQWLRRDYPELNLITAPTLESALQQVARGRAFALVGNMIATSYYISQSGISHIKVIGETEYTNELAMAIRKDWELFPGILEKALEAIPEKEKNVIFNEWTSVEYRHSVDYTLLLQWLAAAGVILLWFLFSNRRLHKEIDHRRSVEKALIHAKQSAEQASKEAKKAANVKSQFLANMSHEIRTPINTVISAGHLLNETPLSKTQQEYLGMVSHSADALLDTIDDILDFSKGEAGKLTLDSKSFQVADVLHQAQQMFALAAQEKKLSLSFRVASDVPETLRGDPDKLGQILRNLVANAIKFTDKGSVNVTVELLYFNEANRRAGLKVNVQDTGIGMSPDFMKKLFLPFSQEENSSSRLNSGTGLGLSISQQLAQLMGGSISAESTVNEGSTFSVELPFKLNKPEPVAVSASSNSPVEPSKIQPLEALAGTHVLLVEDHELNQYLCKTLLQMYGTRVETASSGEEALNALKASTFDLIFMDIQMPGMDGYETTRIIRGHEKWKNIPIIALSAHVLSDEREHSLAAGMNDYVSKPFTPEQLKEAMLKWIILKQ